MKPLYNRNFGAILGMEMLIKKIARINGLQELLYIIRLIMPVHVSQYGYLRYQ
ncbi:MAG: hypothetical protein JWP67_807 [Mucilaginibacter sp.]|nr:hypothetical protein [Mucilaginibacter sp.]MDB5287710.1 hypothetical protein [Mucilaginibacter sp.]